MDTLKSADVIIADFPVQELQVLKGDRQWLSQLRITIPLLET